MPNQEQGSIPRGKSERRLVFDEKKGKWRMESLKENGEVNRGGHPRGQPISPCHAQRMHDGLKQYWRKLRDNTLLYQQHTDKMSEAQQHRKKRE